MDALYVLLVSFAAAMVVGGLYLRNSRPVPPPTVADPAAWQKNVETRWSRDE